MLRLSGNWRSCWHLCCVAKRFTSFVRTQSNYEVEIQLEQELKNKLFERQVSELFYLLLNGGKENCPYEILKDKLGYIPVVRNSSISDAGLGVFLEGKVQAGELVGIYPGLIYEPEDPALWASWRNDYFLRRNDGSSVDGKFYGLSGWMYKSTALKNRMHLPGGITEICDLNWVDYSRSVRKQNIAKIEKNICKLENPLNTGHFINCAADGVRANVMYYEYNFTCDFPIELRKYLPNVSYNSNISGDLLVKSILMISLRSIEDEELFSDYSFIGA